LTHEEEAQLMNALKEYPFLGNTVTMAIYTEFRRGEIFRLKWTDVDFNLRIVRAIDKNGEEKAIPIANKLLRILQSLPKDNELVFPSPRTQKQLTDVKKGFKKGS
jgi:integrase